MEDSIVEGLIKAAPSQGTTDQPKPEPGQNQQTPEPTPVENQGGEKNQPEPTDNSGQPEVKKNWYEETTPLFEKENLPEEDPEIAELKAIKELVYGNPELKSIVDTVRSNGDVTQIFNKFKTKDVESMSPLELKKIELKAHGLSEDEIAEEMADFESKSPAKQKMETANIRERLKMEQDKRIQELNASKTEVTKRIEANHTKAVQDLDTISREMVGKEIYGLTITPEMVDNIKYAINNISVIGDAEKGYDISKSFDWHFRAIYLPQIVSVNVTKQSNQATEKILDTVTRPSNENSGRPANQQSGTKTEINSAFSQAFGGQ